MEEVTCEELLELHQGLIYYYVRVEGKESPLDREDVISIAHLIFMECFHSWDGKRPFGKYFGTSLHYAISDARCGEVFRHVAAPMRVKVAASRMLRYGADDMDETMVVKASILLSSEVLEGGSPSHEEDGTSESLIETAADDIQISTKPLATKNLMLEKMYSSFNRLNYQEERVVRMLLTDSTREDISRQLNLSRGRVSQIYLNALRKLRAGMSFPAVFLKE